MKPHYKIYFHCRTDYDKIQASNYLIDSGFVTFYVNVTMENLNVASYPSNEVAKVVWCNEDKQQSREEKLERILKKDPWYKRIFKREQKLNRILWKN